MTTTPKRIQRKRTRGWRMPAGAVYVGRPTKWGNPYVVHEHTDRCGEDLESCPAWCNPATAGIVSTRADAATSFRHAYQFPVIGDGGLPSIDEIRDELAGRDLVCWCPLDQPCHADVLLKLANTGKPV